MRTPRPIGDRVATAARRAGSHFVNDGARRRGRGGCRRSGFTLPLEVTRYRLAIWA